MQESHVRLNTRFVVPLVAWAVLAAGCATTSLTRGSTSAPPAEAPHAVASRPAPAPAEPRKGSHTPVAKQPSAPAPPPSESTTPSPARGAAVAKSAPAPPPPAPSWSGKAAALSSPIAAQATALLKKMTLVEKVGQIFILPLIDRTTERYDRTPTGNALRIIERYHPGGVILFGGNIDTVDQTQSLIRGIQAASPVPLFVAVDEEGGEVSRLSESGRMRVVHMPAEAIVGATGDPRLAYDEGRYVGRELRSLGINMDLAPVADVDTNPANTVIGLRAYSSNPRVAARMTSAMVRGLQSVAVSSVIKHFPGHGDTAGDSHDGPAIVYHTLSHLRQVEFLPFKAGIAAGADGVMVGHLLLPDILEQKSIPSSLSPYVIGELLRKELGFKGLVITDALNMGAIADSWSSDTAALDAFVAGADMLLMPASPRAAFNAILAAVKSGEITIDRLNESVYRILTVKLQRRVIGTPLPPINPHEILGSAEGRRLLAEIVRKAAKHEAVHHR